MRLFVAVNFSDNTISRLVALRDELRSNSKSGNFTLIENLHLTLAFIGECNEKQAASIMSVMDTFRFATFDITIDCIGRFKRNDGDVLWAGFAIEKRACSPHITIGRKVVTNAAPRNIKPFGETITGTDLMKSERVCGKLTYTVIHTKAANE